MSDLKSPNTIPSFPTHKFTHCVKPTLHLIKTRSLYRSPPTHLLSLSPPLEFIATRYLAKMEGVQVLTRNNRSTGPESKQKRLPDLCPRCQSPNYILRNLSLCSGQHVSDQMIDLCSLRNLKEGINDLVNKQAGRYRRKLNNPVTAHNCSSLSFWIYFPYIYVFSNFMIK